MTITRTIGTETVAMIYPCQGRFMAQLFGRCEGMINSFSTQDAAVKWANREVNGAYS